mgnify:CR=1 FL=1
MTVSFIKALLDKHLAEVLSMSTKPVSRREFLKYGALAAGAAIVAGGAVYYATRPAPPPAPKAAIKIGDLSGKTGVGANWGLHMTLGTKLAVDELNAAGGVLGRPVEIVTEDTALRADVAIKKAEKLILEDKVAAIFGVLSSGVQRAVIKVTEKYKTLHFLCVACADYFRTVDFHKYFFTVHQDGRMSHRALVTWLEKEYNPDPTKLLITYQDYAMGWAHERAVRKIFEHAFGKKGTNKVAWPLGARDFTPWFPKIKEIAPEYYHSSTWGMDSITQIRQMGDYGLLKGLKSFTGSCCIYLTSDLTFYGPTADGTAFPKYWAYPSPNKESIDFRDKFFATFGQTPNQASAAHYEGVKLWAKAVEKAGTTDPDAVVEKLEGMEYTGPLGPGGTKVMRKEDHAAIFDNQITLIDKGKEVVVATVDGKVCAGKPMPKFPIPEGKTVEDAMEAVYDQDSYKPMPDIKKVRYEA